VFTLSSFVLPLFTHGKVFGYYEKLEAQDETDRNFDGLYGTIAKKYGLGSLKLLMLVGALLMSAATAQFIGKAHALNQKEFLVLSSSPEMVVLRIYGDRMIVAPFDRKTQEFESKFVIKTLGADDTLVISPEDIGPLKLSKPSPTPTSTSIPSPTATASPVLTETPVP